MRARLCRGGESGPAVVPGKLDESLIWDQVADDDMPPRPEEPLIGRRKGSSCGGGSNRGPETCRVPTRSARSPPWTDHWAFGRLTSPSATGVRGRARVRTAIDRFIQQALEDRGLTIGPDAGSRHDHPPFEL